MISTRCLFGTVGVFMVGSVAHGQVALINGGFEDPLVGGVVVPIRSIANGQIMQFDASDVPGWETTDTSNAIEIWKDGAGGVNAFRGDQFAEINATTTGILSTMVSPSVGSTIGFEFAHRGRDSSTVADVALVEIFDLGGDGVLGTGDDTRLMSEQFAATNVAWNFHQRPLGAATGNTLLLRFGTFSTASTSPAGGNFLDGVRFGENVPAPGSAAVALIGAMSLRRRRAR